MQTEVDWITGPFPFWSLFAGTVGPFEVADARANTQVITGPEGTIGKGKPVPVTADVVITEPDRKDVGVVRSFPQHFSRFFDPLAAQRR